jgi:hypothetical protein
MLSLSCFVHARGAGTYEVPPALTAADQAPEGVPLKGEHYAVDPEVASDGFLMTFTIRSDFGRIEARGPGVLRMRIAEVDAVAQLRNIEKMDVFVDSVGQSAAAVGGAVANVVTNTSEVLKAAPASVGRFLERTARQTKTAVQKLDDVRQNKEAGAPKGAEAGTSTQNLAVAAGVAAGRATRDILGYDEKRRGLARELKVDPYSTNPVLKKELDDVAWAAFAGGLGIDVLTAQIPGGRVLQSSSVITDWIYEKPPGDLKVWIEKTLKTMGVDQATVDHFLRQKYWTLTTQTALVHALERLKDVQGRAAVVDTAISAEDEDQARFLAFGITMLAREHESEALVEILDGKPIGRNKSGRIVATMPLDYVTWNERVENFADREDLGAKDRVVILTGRLSPRAHDEMKKRGWVIRERAALAEAF